jgi:hypothetical protein
MAESAFRRAKLPAFHTTDYDASAVVRIAQLQHIVPEACGISSEHSHFGLRRDLSQQGWQ